MPCNTPVISPISPKSVGISDHEAIIWFFKPLTDQYDYQMLYVINGETKQKAYWTTYGPVWADFISGLTAKKSYHVDIYFLCYKNKAERSASPGKTVPMALDTCEFLNSLKASKKSGKLTYYAFFRP